MKWFEVRYEDKNTGKKYVKHVKAESVGEAILSIQRQTDAKITLVKEEEE